MGNATVWRCKTLRDVLKSTSAFPGSLRPLSTPTTFSPVANHRPAIIPNGRLPSGVYAAKTEASVRASYQRPVALSENSTPGLSCHQP